MEDSSKDYQEAQKIYEQASAAAAGGKTSWLFFKEGPDYNRASELFTDAGNKYKCAKAWKEAGEAFMRAAEADLKANEPEEAARHHVSAAQAYKKVEPVRAIEALKLCIEAFLKAGRFHLAATNEREIAEIYEGILDDQKMAAAYYERAADRFTAEDAVATALGCQIKAATLGALVGDYALAIRILQAVCKQWAGDEMKRYSMKDYLLKLGLCYLLAGDLVQARREVDKFAQLDSHFAGAHECKLLTVRRGGARACSNGVA